jgi:transposase
MTAKRTYYPPTTPQQRKKLFESWEKSKNITAACRKAHVGRGTFYNWKPRYLKAGFGGVESYAKLGTPVGTGRVAAEIQSKVLGLHAAHADWGKKRLANELSKANNWVPLVSPNSVRRILREAGLWDPGENKEKKVRSHQ